MGNDWEIAIKSLSKITVISNSNNDPVSISGITNDLKCIGVGTDAAVFQCLNEPSYAFKLYAKEKIAKVEIEANVYRILGESPYFSTCFASYDKFLVLGYEEGLTLFDCIVQGIHIPHQVVVDVEEARKFVRSKELNPRDIHLKNILLQNGRAKIIDVSEYMKPGNDFRWEHLKMAYEQYYPIIDGNPIPFRLVDTIRRLYNLRIKKASLDDEFVKIMWKLLSKDIR